jgi:hypothetical protein
LLKITNIAVCVNHPMIISCLVRMKNRPELKDKTSCVRKLVKGDRRNVFHTDGSVTADVGIPG